MTESANLSKQLKNMESFSQHTDTMVNSIPQSMVNEFEQLLAQGEQFNNPLLVNDVQQAEAQKVNNSSPIIGEDNNVVAKKTELTLGDRILQGMQDIRSHVEAGVTQVESVMAPARTELSMRDMFHTQWTMSRLMLTEDFIGKVVSKGTQSFDSMLKNQ